MTELPTLQFRIGFTELKTLLHVLHVYSTHTRIN